MTRRDVNEGDVFRKGFATNALEKGAIEGQIPAVDADGEMVFANAGGGSQPGHGAMLQPIQTFDGDNAIQANGSHPRMFVIYDTDDFIADATPDYVNRLVIPVGLAGTYVLETVLYLIPNPGDPGLTQATFVLDEPTNSGDFDVRASLVQEFVGSISITRPLLEGDVVQINCGDIAGATTCVIQGGTWLTDPDNPDGPGITQKDLASSLLTVTRIGELPDGFTGYGT